MADNIALPGTGSVIATDDIAGAQHQRIKIEAGESWVTNTDDGPEGTALELAARVTDNFGDAALMVVNSPQVRNFALIDAGDTTAQTYSIGDAIGGNGELLTSYLDFATSPLLDSICLLDGSDVGPDVDLYFSGNSHGTVADGAAWAPDVASLQLGGIIRVPVAAADWVDLGSVKMCVKTPQVRIPDGASQFRFLAIAKSSYTLATNGHFLVSACVDFS
jgi:hypothetical protein